MIDNAEAVRSVSLLGPLPDSEATSWHPFKYTDHQMRDYAAKEVDADRERLASLLSESLRIAEQHIKRADDCGRLSRALLDALDVFMPNTGEKMELKKITGSELIARQARQIKELRDEVADLKECARRARLHIYCIGGPLNDNKLGYTREQMFTFQRIADELHDG